MSKDNQILLPRIPSYITLVKRIKSETISRFNLTYKIRRRQTYFLIKYLFLYLHTIISYFILINSRPPICCRIRNFSPSISYNLFHYICIPTPFCQYFTSCSQRFVIHLLTSQRRQKDQSCLYMFCYSHSLYVYISVFSIHPRRLLYSNMFRIHYSLQLHILYHLSRTHRSKGHQHYGKSKIRHNRKNIR